MSLPSLQRLAYLVLSEMKEEACRPSIMMDIDIAIFAVANLNHEEVSEVEYDCRVSNAL